MTIYSKSKEKLFAILSNLQNNWICLKIDLSKHGPTYKGQVVIPRPRTPQGQRVTKPETPLQKILVRECKHDTIEFRNEFNPMSTYLSDGRYMHPSVSNSIVFKSHL